jgi:NADPH-dependent curcumin reductase CurA
MTCDEFRSGTAGGKVTGDYTRAERAAFVAHVLGCDSCQDHVMDQVEAIVAEKGIDYAADQVQTSMRLGDRDLQDPEYRKVVGL